MKSEDFQGFGFLHRLCLTCGLTAGLAIIGGASPGAGQSLQSAQDVLAQQEAHSQTSAFTTTVAYVVQFYPLWFTYNQSLGATRNRLVGPDRISPAYQTVVAVNVDTLYASTFLDLTAQPVILTIPATAATYSVLTLDPYGDIFDSGIKEPQVPQTTELIYALIGPGFIGTLPAGVTPIAMPLNFMSLLFRVDKFSSTGENQITQAEMLRASLLMQTLSDYLTNPSGGTTLIVPEIPSFAVPYKTTADELIARDPITFLKQLQTAVASSNTPPLSPFEQALSNRFNSLFGNGDFGGRAKKSQFSDGAQAAHDLILDRYLTHTDRTNWIHFTNIGDWGDHVIERSSITEFIQYGNGISTAAYYQTFSDDRGRPLDGSNPHGYVLKFPKGELPEAERFWSITAYTPESIELVDNPANKYVVASYTPGLQFNADGSLSVYLARQLPAAVPMANWLPIPPRAFNIMLRVYGPEGKVAEDRYVPPGIQKR